MTVSEDLDATDDARRRIMSAARRVFIEGPPERGTMDEVARVAGMSKRTIYRVFPGQFDLLRALFEESAADALPALPAPSEETFEADLVQLLVAMLGLFVAPRTNALMRLLVMELRRYPHLLQHAPRRGRGHQMLAEWLDAPLVRRLIDVDDADETAALLLGMALQDLPLRLLLGQDVDLSPERLETRCRRAVRLFLDGARRRA